MKHSVKISDSNNLLDHIHIYNEKLSARIYPNLGGSIQQLIVNNVKIIDGISNDQKGIDDYATTYKSSVLFPFPNRIEDGSYEFMETKYQLPVNEPSVNNAIHGVVYNKAFEISAVESEKDVSNIVLSYSSKGATPGFPFPFELKLTYSIYATGSLKLKFDILNKGDQPFPYGLGWHPYFLADSLKDCTLSFPSRDFYLCNKRSLPVNMTASSLSESFKMADSSFDDAYSLNRSECRFESNSYSLNLAFDYPEGTYLQVYTPPHRQSIAIEPMTCVANSFNNQIGLKELLPGTSDSWTIHMDLNVK
jgi:aldose 1-epimerase